MIKFFTIFLLFIFITNCSLDTKSSLWTKNKKIEREKQKNIKVLFEDEEALKKEFNPNLTIMEELIIMGI